MYTEIIQWQFSSFIEPHQSSPLDTGIHRFQHKKTQLRSSALILQEHEYTFFYLLIMVPLGACDIYRSNNNTCISQISSYYNTNMNYGDSRQGSTWYLFPNRRTSFLEKILFSDSIRQYLIKTKIIFIMVIRLKKNKTKGLWATSLTRKTVPINEHIFVKLWLYNNVDLIREKKRLSPIWELNVSYL